MPGVIRTCRRAGPRYGCRSARRSGPSSLNARFTWLNAERELRVVARVHRTGHRGAGLARRRFTYPDYRGPGAADTGGHHDIGTSQAVAAVAAAGRSAWVGVCGDHAPGGRARKKPIMTERTAEAPRRLAARYELDSSVGRLPPAERVARGKAARARTPRESRAIFDPPSDRADPIGLLERQAKWRVPELVPIRYGRMMVSPFTYFRGAADGQRPGRHPGVRAGGTGVRGCALVQLRPVRLARAPPDVRRADQPRRRLPTGERSRPALTGSPGLVVAADTLRDVTDLIYRRSDRRPGGRPGWRSGGRPAGLAGTAAPLSCRPGPMPSPTGPARPRR
jgi:Uncharacterized protein conserved in bacteria (DUF2252)